MNTHQLRSFGCKETYIFELSELWRDWLRRERRDFMMIIQQELSEFNRGAKREI